MSVGQAPPRKIDRFVKYLHYHAPAADRRMNPHGVSSVGPPSPPSPIFPTSSRFAAGKGAKAPHRRGWCCRPSLPTCGTGPRLPAAPPPAAADANFRPSEGSLGGRCICWDCGQAVKQMQAFSPAPAGAAAAWPLPITEAMMPSTKKARRDPRCSRHHRSCCCCRGSDRDLGGLCCCCAAGMVPSLPVLIGTAISTRESTVSGGLKRLRRPDCNKKAGGACRENLDSILFLNGLPADWLGVGRWLATDWTEPPSRFC